MTVGYEYNASGAKARATFPTIGLERHYLGGVFERDVRSWGDSDDPWGPPPGSETVQRLFLGGNAYNAPMVLAKVNDGPWTPYNIGRDTQGSITHVMTADGELLERYVYDPWGKVAQADSTGYVVDTLCVNPWGGGGFWSKIVGSHGYTGHEHIVGCGLINANARIYDPFLGRFLSPDPLIQNPASTQNFNRYAYCLNNPLKYTDEDGEFLVWSIGTQGFGIGVNFTPILVPLGLGINVGWADGLSLGVYAEIGFRVGGTGFGSGLTNTFGIDYNFKYNTWSPYITYSVYGSLGPFSAAASTTYTNYDMTWNIAVGVGIGNDALGGALTVGYGSDGWSWGVGGYYYAHAWDDNPEYDPNMWNDNGTIQFSNNCYSYALDDPNNPIGGKPQPGDYSGIRFQTLEPVAIIEAAMRDGRIIKPSIWNRLGFGKKGYYSVCLVLDLDGPIKDYHWYRQDKGGYWSQKHGSGYVTNVDGANRRIISPSIANHNYGLYRVQFEGGAYGLDALHYNSRRYYLWVKK